MSIASCFKAAKAGFDAFTGEPLVSQALGAHHLSDASVYPRIVWSVVGGPTRVTKQAGNNTAPRAGTQKGLKQIRRRTVRVDVHIWGEKGESDEDRFEACERLMQDYNAALRVALTGFSYRQVDEDWTVGQQQKTDAGQLVIVSIEINLPLTFEAKTVVTGLRPAVTPAFPHP